MKTNVRTGLDVLYDSGFAALRDRRVGLMTNPSAVDSDLVSAYQRFAQAPNVKLTALFGPEHGFAAAVADGEPVTTGRDARTGLPVYSLYGPDLRPSAEMLTGIDVLVCDIQDIGVRYYTFVSTVSYILEAAGEHGIAVMILDRPNPLGGERIAGPLLEAEWASFVGRYPVPICHGMTLGEMAQMINALWNPTPADLSVIPCAGWRRSLTWAQTGLAWVSPSPNMSHLSTLDHYPGACLIEGTTLSEGRGTALPFEVVGAPGLDGEALAENLNAQNWPGVRFRPHSFRPSEGKWAGHDCTGVQAHLSDRRSFQPIETWLALLIAVHEMLPARGLWSEPNPDGRRHFDLLLGSDALRLGIEARLPLDKLTWSWPGEGEQFRQQRQPFLLYDD